MAHNKKRFETPQYQDCFRCGQPITNPFTKRAWCDDCSTELQQMSFTGEEALDMMVSLLPPTRLRAVLVATMYERGIEIMQQKNLVLMPAEDDSDGYDDTHGGQPAILVAA